jgi:hypothetical protein
MSVPAALANAVADALAPLGIELNSLPVHGNVLHDLISPDPDNPDPDNTVEDGWH